VTKTRAIWKPSRNNKAGFNALAVEIDSDGEENRSQPLEGVKSCLSGKVKVCFVPLELEHGDSDSTMENKNRNSENEDYVRNSSMQNSKVTQSVDLDGDNINEKEKTHGRKGKIRILLTSST
jgi:predicted transcriptional regulator